MRARVSLAVVLLDQHEATATVKVHMQRAFTSETPLTGTDAPAIAAALRTGLADVLGRIEAAVTREGRPLLDMRRADAIWSASGYFPL